MVALRTRRFGASILPCKEDVSERAVLEAQLAQVVQQLKAAEEGGEDKTLYQKMLAELVRKLKEIDLANEARAKQRAAAVASAAAKVKVEASARPVMGPKPPGSEEDGLRPPPLPREQHHPLPPKRQREKPVAEAKVEPKEVRETREMLLKPFELLNPIAREFLATDLSEADARRTGRYRVRNVYTDQHEYPDPVRGKEALRVAVGAFLCGIVASQADLFPATWFIWSFLLVHLVGVLFLTDYANQTGLLVLCAIFGLHAGFALSETCLWMLDLDGADSVGPWSILVFFSCTSMGGFLLDGSHSAPARLHHEFNAAVLFSCLELFLEWRWFPDFKIWRSFAVLGAALCVCGQWLIASASHVGQRNYWASCRNMPEEEERPEDFVGLEIPDRRIVQEGVYRCERHPAYSGAMLWGLGIQIALCNPVMLVLVSFVLWASLLYVALEEEQELYDEFKGGYANYAALTSCWIPLFNSFLEDSAFQREMQDNCEEENEHLQEETEEEEIEDDLRSEDDLLPTWEGVPKGGSLWNRQFREPWMLG
ncbi:Protein-S-isoprenylcysteine O-methyltransferase B (AtICMTB) (Isoprenylcysteine carboxylmethyltransferase B) (Prenylated protein carboxyl methyltransferase B) (Prenylcysteine carboxyl methyltransferase B) [Durusdinium trenchii]|uniref:Protein-S-isoprenylcysteine O-methyltransferase n=1 Tax=Durusdinium trenchii TaxID=1381693 RepID=A0ABP0NN55_9DINO